MSSAREKPPSCAAFFATFVLAIGWMIPALIYPLAVGEMLTHRFGIETAHILEMRTLPINVSQSSFRTCVFGTDSVIGIGECVDGCPDAGCRFRDQVFCRSCESMLQREQLVQTEANGCAIALCASPLVSLWLFFMVRWLEGCCEGCCEACLGKRAGHRVHP